MRRRKQSSASILGGIVEQCAVVSGQAVYRVAKGADFYQEQDQVTVKLRELLAGADRIAGGQAWVLGKWDVVRQCLAQSVVAARALRGPALRRFDAERLALELGNFPLECVSLAEPLADPDEEAFAQNLARIPGMSLEAAREFAAMKLLNVEPKPSAAGTVSRPRLELVEGGRP